LLGLAIKALINLEASKDFKLLPLYACHAQHAICVGPLSKEGSQDAAEGLLSATNLVRALKG